VTESPLEAAWSEFSYHGGNLGAARRLFPNAPTPWIDLSTGVNPQAYPLPPLASGDWARLPEPEPVAALEAEAARRYGADAGQTIAASGTQAVIQLLARLRPARRVAILGFTYRGHERAWAAAGAKVETVENIADLAAADVAIVVNPNNPDGRLTDRARLAEIHAEIAARGGILVVDEAFMDLNARDDSLAPILPGKSAIILRSFGKTYGLAGLRLGFAIASQDIAGTLRDGLGPWPVSGPAIAVGRVALADDAWLEQAGLRLARDAGRLDRLLVERGFESSGGTTLFRLARHPRAADVFVDLMRCGILVRPFSAFPDRLRFGLPGDAEAWRRLEAALQSRSLAGGPIFAAAQKGVRDSRHLG
jgi:cobalamin biosynthetic protein CobC